MKRSAAWVPVVNLAVALAAVASLPACPRVEPPPAPVAAPEPAGPVGAVVTATNLEAGNGIVLFDRDERGLLTYVDTFSTAGLGSPDSRPVDPLGSQDSILIADGRLYTVNAGSDQLSVFTIGPSTLTLVGAYPSGGDFPVGVAVRGDLLYALNVGGKGNVAGFRIGADGSLTPLAGSSRELDLTPADPVNTDQAASHVGFVPGRDLLLVTTKGFAEPGPTGKILAYRVGADGLLSDAPVVTDSAGRGPFGFAFGAGGHLLVVESAGGAGIDGHSSGAVSSYRIEEDGRATAISPSVDCRNRGSCWIAVHGPYAWTTNPSGSTLSGYRIAADGTLTLLQEDGTAAKAGEATYPLDLAVTADGKFLYTLNPGQNSIGIFSVESATGDLTLLGMARIRPESFQSLQGIAVYDYR
jgi:6-phosphogluconolactonase (cycloisomerase 2 family)